MDGKSNGIIYQTISKAQNNLEDLKMGASKIVPVEYLFKMEKVDQ